MPSLKYSDEQIRAEAVRLGLVGEGEPISPAVRSRAASALMAQRQLALPATRGPRLAKVFTVRPGRGPLVDGKPFPWLVTDDPMAVEVRPDGSGFVRLTIPAELVRIDSDTDSPEESEPRA